MGGWVSNNVDTFSRISTIEQDVWKKIDEHMRNYYGENNLWSTVIAPYLNKFISEEVCAREKIECIDELMTHLDGHYLDSQRYRLIPEEFRLFLESSGETTFILGYRLTESLRSLDKIVQLREILQDYNSQPNLRYEKYELYEILKRIDLIINSSH